MQGIFHSLFDSTVNEKRLAETENRFNDLNQATALMGDAQKQKALSVLIFDNFFQVINQLSILQSINPSTTPEQRYLYIQQ